jgi:hypothetical protein
MTAAPVVPTLRHPAPENRPLPGFLAASCESRARRWPAPSNGQVRQDKFLEPLKAQFRRNLLPARTFRHFRPQKGERVSNQALGPEFSDSNTLPVEPTWPKTRNE